MGTILAAVVTLAFCVVVVFLMSRRPVGLPEPQEFGRLECRRKPKGS